jgi:hypothetical protein
MCSCELFVTNQRLKAYTKLGAGCPDKRAANSLQRLWDTLKPTQRHSRTGPALPAAARRPARARAPQSKASPLAGAAAPRARAPPRARAGPAGAARLEGAVLAAQLAPQRAQHRHQQRPAQLGVVVRGHAQRHRPLALGVQVQPRGHLRGRGRPAQAPAPGPSARAGRTPACPAELGADRLRLLGSGQPGRGALLARLARRLHLPPRSRVGRPERPPASRASRRTGWPGCRRAPGHCGSS